MKTHLRVFAFLASLIILLGACAPTPTEPEVEPTQSPVDETATEESQPIEVVETEEVQEEPQILYVNLTWHQHQPLYYKDENGIYTRPWVRAV